MSREEHLAWCKERAMQYVDAGDFQNAVQSMLSDLGKHPGTADSQMVGFIASFRLSTAEDARRWVEGFN